MAIGLVSFYNSFSNNLLQLNTYNSVPCFCLLYLHDLFNVRDLSPYALRADMSIEQAIQKYPLNFLNINKAAGDHGLARSFHQENYHNQSRLQIEIAEILACLVKNVFDFI